MNLRRYLFLLFAFTYTFCSFGQSKPNVIIIIADDQGWGDLSAHGNCLINTPSLDQFISKSTSFSNFYVNPVCSPTRASLLTGRYSPRTGVVSTTRGLEAMNNEELTIAEILKSNGYKTALFGKWHLGWQYQHHPNQQGFDQFFGFESGLINQFDPVFDLNGKAVQTSGYAPDVITGAAIQFISESKKEPFFCMISLSTPHVPFHVPDPLFDKYKKMGFDDHTSCVYGMVENIDQNFSKVISVLEKEGLYDNSIIVFMSDNGPNTYRYNGNLKGKKTDLDEGGLKVPFYVSFPGQKRAGDKINEVAAHIDVLPTILELCRLKKPSNLAIDGISLLPLLKGKETGLPDRSIYTHTYDLGSDSYDLSVRSEQYRFIHRSEKPELYDLEKDPQQERNIAGEHPELVKTMEQSANSWKKEVSAIVKRPKIQIRKEVAVLELPADESNFTKGLRYKGYGSFNDFIIHWENQKDSVWWKTEVMDEGLYHVSLNYAIEKLGSPIMAIVSSSNNRISAPVSEAFYPEPIPVPDRGQKMTLPHKEFKELQLGKLKIAKGTTDITLKFEGKTDDFPEVHSIKLTKI